MKQIQHLDPSARMLPDSPKAVRNVPVAPFSLPKTKREEGKRQEAKHQEAKHDKRAEERRHEPVMDDAPAVAVQEGRTPSASNEPSGESSGEFSMAGKYDGGARGDAALGGSSTAMLARAGDAAALAGQDSLVEDLAALGADPGVFEVTMPEGDTLGVSVDHRAQSVMFLLSASDPALAKKLKRQSAELQSQLAQRMDTDVGLVVL